MEKPQIKDFQRAKLQTKKTAKNGQIVSCKLQISIFITSANFIL